jgi:O-antigen/teichoic acid export membrane protein
MLGSWNRSAVVTQVPMEMIQNSLAQVIYPEFRHDIVDADRASRLWPDLLALATWVMLPLGAVAGAGAYFAVPLVLGPGWQTAASLAPWLAMAAAVNVPGLILGSALEATGRFGGVWPTRIASLVILAISALIALLTHAVGPVIAGLLAAPVLGHALQLSYVRREGIFSVAAILHIYPRILAATAVAGLLTALGLGAVCAVGSLTLKIALAVGMVLAAGTILWLTRLRLPPIRIARRYGIFPGLR